MEEVKFGEYDEYDEYDKRWAQREKTCCRRKVPHCVPPNLFRNASSPL